MSSSKLPDGDVREPIARTVIRQAWANVDNFGTLVWLVIGTVALASANVADAIDAKTTGGLVVLVGAAAGVWATVEVLRERTAELRTLLGTPDLSITAGPQLGVAYGGEAGTLSGVSDRIRVVVGNHSVVAHRLIAKVVDIDGVRPGPEVPWPVQWRDGTPDGVHRLFPGDVEMLDVAGLLNRASKDPFLEVFLPQPHRAALASLPATPVRLRVNIWDAEGGQLAADFTVVIPTPRASASFSIELHGSTGCTGVVSG